MRRSPVLNDALSLPFEVVATNGSRGGLTKAGFVHEYGAYPGTLVRQW